MLAAPQATGKRKQSSVEERNFNLGLKEFPQMEFQETQNHKTHGEVRYHL